MSEQPAGSSRRKQVRPAQDPAQALAAHAPWKPVDADPEDVGALQAVHRGDAVEHQQRRAIDFILKLSWNGGALYFPTEGGRRDTDYALGRAFVGQQIATLLKQKLVKGGEQR